MKLKKSPLALLFAALLLAAGLAGTLAGCGTPATGNTKTPEKAAAAPVKPGDTLHDRLAGKKWLLAGYDAGSLFVPLEPGHGSSAWILFLPDGRLNGTTGINTFSGSWKLGTGSGAGTDPNRGTAVTITVGGMTRMAAPNEIAAKFEQDILRELGEARRLKTGKDSILLADAQDKTLLRFIYRGETSLF